MPALTDVHREQNARHAEIARLRRTVTHQVWEQSPGPEVVDGRFVTRRRAVLVSITALENPEAVLAAMRAKGPAKRLYLESVDGL
jgi:hypothetical protein